MPHLLGEGQGDWEGLRQPQRREWSVILKSSSDSNGCRSQHLALHRAGRRRCCSGLQVKGNKVYSKLKFESGVHRVQRVPATESSGRVHTSTATVAIMPEVGAVHLVDSRSGGKLLAPVS